MNRITLRARAIYIGFLICAVTACSRTPVPEIDTTDVPANWQGPVEADSAVWPNLDWWQNFESSELTEIVDDKTFKGKVSVRLGPVALTFQGTATFEDVDEIAHKATVKAQGADAKGRGGASANVGFHLEPSDGGSVVKIHTDLQLSGSVAQYGRGAGMIQDLASQIIGQFADNLEKNVIAPQASAPTEEATQDSSPAEPEAPPQPEQAAPVQVGGMGLIVLWNAIKRLFGVKT